MCRVLELTFPTAFRYRLFLGFLLSDINDRGRYAVCGLVLGSHCVLMATTFVVTDISTAPMAGERRIPQPTAYWLPGSWREHSILKYTEPGMGKAGEFTCIHDKWYMTLGWKISKIMLIDEAGSVIYQ